MAATTRGEKKHLNTKEYVRDRSAGLDAFPGSPLLYLPPITRSPVARTLPQPIRPNPRLAPKLGAFPNSSAYLSGMLLSTL